MGIISKYKKTHSKSGAWVITEDGHEWAQNQHTEPERLISGRKEKQNELQGLYQKGNSKNCIDRFNGNFNGTDGI